MRPLLLASTLALLTLGCTPSDPASGKDDTGGADGGDGGGGGGDGGGGDGGGDPEPETSCDDGVDDDLDGATDCDDSDCAEVAPCWWPATLQHQGAFDFDGYTVTCETFFGDFDEDVPDCSTRYEATLVEVTDPAEACPTCDRTYYGTLTYTTDSCGDILGSGDYPTEAYFGFVFHDADRWTLYGEDDAGSWATGVDLTVSGGSYSFTHLEPIYVDTGECDNDPLLAGELAVTWAFTR
jgi:hypothetical protein